MLEIRTVLCPVDFSVLCEREIRLAGDICRRFGARLVLEHNLDPRPPGYLSVTWMWSEDHEAEEVDKAMAADRRMQELFNRVPEVVPVEGKISRGPIEMAILYLARELPADLILMGSHGWSTAEHRSVTERIVAQSPCPVLTLREGGTDTPLFRKAAPGKERGEGQEYWEVVVPTDFSPHSQAAMEYAFELAETLPLHLRLVYVEAHPGQMGRRAAEEADPPWLQKSKERLAGLIPASLEGRVDSYVRTGRPGKEIQSLCDEVGATLVIMGAHAKGVVRQVMEGAPSRELLHESSCPVLLVPAAAGEKRGRRDVQLAGRV